MSLVDSWPSTLIRSNERLTHTPSSRSQVAADIAASVCTKHSSVANPGEIIPAPLAWAVSRTVPLGSVTCERRPLLERVGGLDRLGEVAVAVGRELVRGGGDPAGDRVHRQRHADHAGRGDRDPALRGAGDDRARALHLGRVVESRAPGGGVGVAGVDDHRAQRAELAALGAEQHRRRQRARAGEARRAGRRRARRRRAARGRARRRA